ncbi:hypothetical protein [Burkholderia ambifaria]|uniref:hypothetical protein n=1 Tax=Burkholderia ambifaria TaxID=152480 RepID=UPI0012FD0D09|nr:hypothetical protein [Burkholderia ambifaria]
MPKTTEKTVHTSDLNTLARELKQIKNTLAEQPLKPGWLAKKPDELDWMLKVCLRKVDAACEQLRQSSYAHNPKKRKRLEDLENEITRLRRQVRKSAAKDLATERRAQQAPAETGLWRWLRPGRREDRL